MSALGQKRTSHHVRVMSVIFPSKRTFISAVCTSAMCHERTFSLRAWMPHLASPMCSAAHAGMGSHQIQGACRQGAIP